MACRAYGKVAVEINWKSTYQNNIKHQNIVGKEVKEDIFLINKKLFEVHLPPLLATLLPIIVEQE